MTWEVHYDINTKLYEVYHLTEQLLSNGMKQSTETDCFTCDENGEVSKHEVYSEVLSEWRECPLPDKEKKLYPFIFEKLRARLAQEIYKFNEAEIDGMNQAKKELEKYL